MSSILNNPSNMKIISGDRQRNPEIIARYFFQKAVDSAQKDIEHAYNECLSYTHFQGGWHEEPKYAPKVYEGYASLMRSGGQPTRSNLTRYVKILEKEKEEKTFEGFRKLMTKGDF